MRHLSLHTAAQAALAGAAGLLIGTAYTLSPITAWFTLGTILLMAWGAQGLAGRERQWFVVLTAAAVFLRLLALAAFFLVTNDGAGQFAALIPDEPYVALRARLVRYVAMSIPLLEPEYLDYVESYGDTGLHYIFAYVQLLFGESPYAIRLLGTFLHVAGAVILYRVIRVTFGTGVAIGGYAVVLFLPSLFAWSISTLREPFYLFLTAAAVGAFIAMWRAEAAVTRVKWLVGLGAAMAALGSIKPATAATVGAGFLVAALSAGVWVTWKRRPVATLAAAGACVVMGVYAARVPHVQMQIRAAVRAAAHLHRGFGQTPGWNYLLLDANQYAQRGAVVDPIDVMTPGAAVRYFTRAAISFVMVPLPWTTVSRSGLAYIPEQIAWYALIVLACVGVMTGLRRDAPATLVLIGVIGCSAGFIALTSGNVGTLVRHRSVVLMLLPWLSAIGASALVARGVVCLRAREGTRDAIGV